MSQNKSGKSLVFVYGTLKKNGHNEPMMGDSTHLGTAQLEKGTTLYTNGSYPMMVELSQVTSNEHQAHHGGVWGELYEVDQKTLRSLDRFEGHPTLFQRRHVSLSVINLHQLPSCPFVMQAVEERRAEAYYYNQSVEGREAIGNFFPLG